MAKIVPYFFVMAALLAGHAQASEPSAASSNPQTPVTHNDNGPAWTAKGQSLALGGWRFSMVDGKTTMCALVAQPETGVLVTIASARGDPTMVLVVSGDGLGAGQGSPVDMSWRGQEAMLSLGGRGLGEKASGVRINPITDPDRLSLKLIHSSSVLMVGNKPTEHPRVLALPAILPKVLELFGVCLRNPDMIQPGFSYGPEDAARDAMKSKPR